MGIVVHGDSAARTHRDADMQHCAFNHADCMTTVCRMPVEAVDASNLMGVVVHGHSAALAHGEVDVGYCAIRHLVLLAAAAAQHPTVPQGVLCDGLVLH